MTDIAKIIELKNILIEKFGVQLNILDPDTYKYYSVENLIPAAKDYIETFFLEMNYQAVFNQDWTEFTLENIAIC